MLGLASLSERSVLGTLSAASGDSCCTGKLRAVADKGAAPEHSGLVSGTHAVIGARSARLREQDPCPLVRMAGSRARALTRSGEPYTLHPKP